MGMLQEAAVSPPEGQHVSDIRAARRRQAAHFTRIASSTSYLADGSPKTWPMIDASKVICGRG